MAADDGAVKYLVGWTELYARYKSIHSKKASEITRGKDEVRVKIGESVESYHIMPFSLDVSYVDHNCKNADRVFLVTFNMKETLAQLIEVWPKLVPHKNLRVVMVNPFSKKERRWIVCPAVHHHFTDQAALEKGLKALFKTVEPITREKALKKIGRVSKSAR